MTSDGKICQSMHATHLATVAAPPLEPVCCATSQRGRARVSQSTLISHVTSAEDDRGSIKLHMMKVFESRMRHIE
jgi:hypothetical protein